MNKNLIYFFTALSLAAGTIAARAESASVATVPEGLITFTLANGSTTFLSTPLTANATYTSSVTALTSNSISVGDTPAPFTTSLASAAAPYFVKFLSGNEMGRVLLVTANTTSTLTLSTTDNSSQTVSLTSSGFNVQVGDTFEIFPGNTLASEFGSNTAQSPLLLNGATSVYKADCVSVYNPTLIRWQTYYFNTTNGYWELNGSAASANNTILYPYGALTITRRSSETATSFSLVGRVAEVPILTKTTGSNVTVYGSTDYPSNMTLSQLQLGANWIKSSSVTAADTISVWDSTLLRYDTYYQLPTDSTWRKSGNSSTDQSNLVINAGTVISFLQRASVSGASSFLTSVLPYSLN